MSVLPLMLHGDALSTLVVGGGAVATRKALALLESGATVRVVAPTVTPELREAAGRSPRLTLETRRYRTSDIADATVVVAATDARAVNARVAADARARHRLVNVVDAPGEGNCSTAAVHRAGDLTLAVSAGGVPAVAARVRDALAERFDARYAYALGTLGAVRRRLVAAGDRDGWRVAARELVGPDFCASVEGGAFAERAAPWR